jgi:hypothetical protein
MREEVLDAIRQLTIDQAKEVFEQDYEDYDKGDIDYIKAKISLDGYCDGVNDVLKILRGISNES